MHEKKRLLIQTFSRSVYLTMSKLHFCLLFIESSVMITDFDEEDRLGNDDNNRCAFRGRDFGGTLNKIGIL